MEKIKVILVIQSGCFRRIYSWRFQLLVLTKYFLLQKYTSLFFRLGNFKSIATANDTDTWSTKVSHATLFRKSLFSPHLPPPWPSPVYKRKSHQSFFLPIFFISFQFFPFFLMPSSTWLLSKWCEAWKENGILRRLHGWKQKWWIRILKWSQLIIIPKCIILANFLFHKNVWDLKNIG
jgi:hypothetical protein